VLSFAEDSDGSLKEAPANLVPAAAARREGQALFEITGRKGCVGGYLCITRVFWRFLESLW